MQHLPLKSTMEKMYTMNDTLSREIISSPKKENMFHSMFNAFNIIWERFSKVLASFMAGINYPLLLTIMHNRSIISHDFFKDLTTKREMLSPSNVYIQNAQLKESLNIVETMKENLNYNYEHINKKKIDIEIFDRKKSGIKESVTNNSINYNYVLPTDEPNEMFNIHKLFITTNFYNYENTCNESTSKKEQIFNRIDDSLNDNTVMNQESFLSPYSSNIESGQSNHQSTVSNMLINMWQKVYDNVTDRFCRTDSIESDLSMKQSLSPKQRRKLNTIAKGRGRGRAKSQLRRSGVSQTRHRKERAKHDLEIDIKNDFENWQESELYHTIESKKSEDCFRLGKDMIDGIETVNPLTTYTFADVKPKTCKINNHRKSKFSTRMKCIPECVEEINAFHEDCIKSRYNFRRKTFRPRLISESSIDSEDSYCIVFETESGVTYKSDLEDTDESDIDQTSEDENTCKEEKSIFPVQKVKFNLNPVVHTMIQWNYAYRAARRGPWEQMARDRARFKSRINCIEHVLNPILTIQHRTHIWQERFALIE